MLTDAKDGRHAAAAARSLLPVLVILVLLAPIQGANAAVPTTSGSLRLGNTLAYGSTAYSIDYSYPSRADVGSNLTITLLLHVTSLTGLVEFISHYQIIIFVDVGTHVLNGTITGSNNTSLPVPKYTGSAWGPKTVGIPLTVNNTGLQEGQSANATISFTLEDLVWYGTPLALYDTEPPMQGDAGSMTIENSVASTSTSNQGAGQGQTYLPYALLVSGAILMLSAVFLPRPRSAQANQK